MFQANRLRRPVSQHCCIFILIFVAALAIPPPYNPLEWICEDKNSSSCIAPGVQHRVKRQANGPFKYLYVSQCGISATKPSDLPSVEVAATAEASDAGLEKAARLAFLMLRFMPMNFYSKVAQKASMGVVAADQVIGDFPEYASTKDTPACEGICTRGCQRTCTDTGRKYDKLVGYSKERAVVKESNLLCTPSDPYNGRLNVLMHEFAHAIHLVALGTDFRWHSLLDEAFKNRYETWGTGYATSDFREFFAEATTSYFRTSTLGPEAAEMNLCGNAMNNATCPDEYSSRENLKAKDPTLFRLIDYIYSGSRTFLQGRIGICDW